MYLHDVLKQILKMLLTEEEKSRKNFPRGNLTIRVLLHP